MYGYFSEAYYKGDLPYTDLALERHKADPNIQGVEYSKENCPSGSWERIKISTKGGAESIGRPIGLYYTFNTYRVDLLSKEDIENVKDEIASELCRIFELSDVFPGRIVVAGLGNKSLTPDSVGYATASKVKPTMHIKEMDRRCFTRLGCAEIAVITPGVAAESGLDAVVSIKGLCDLIKPDAVIAIDSLATRSPDRLGSTIQICNTGISPGSGIGNTRLAIGVETLAVPVIAIGIPTVIDSRVLCSEEAFSTTPMFVSPKEISEIISCSSEIIGEAINRAFGIYG